jgi:hypothetical protein
VGASQFHELKPAKTTAGAVAAARAHVNAVHAASKKK